MYEQKTHTDLPAPFPGGGCHQAGGRGAGAPRGGARQLCPARNGGQPPGRDRRVPGIQEYEEGLIRLSTTSGTIRFMGRGLVMNCLTEDCAVITGFLLSVEFLS